MLDADVETVVWAKVLIFSLTTAIPLSSEAFNSSTLDRQLSVPNKSLAAAKMVDVLPVPGGP